MEASKKTGAFKAIDFQKPFSVRDLNNRWFYLKILIKLIHKLKKMFFVWFLMMIYYYIKYRDIE